MYTLLLSFIFAASFIWFQTSRKVKFIAQPDFLRKLFPTPRKAVFSALIIYACCLLAICLLQGIGAGIPGFIGILMASFSCIVLLQPYRFWTSLRLAIMVFICLVVETLFTFQTSLF
ncbi:hypothetical protein J5U18_09050 [Sphingobacteriaceae bacterium WQ 2009]|uniref:DUF3325 domain-containing protein n=1 Tax=Rhinopithecimicrobium faecis TaxID=2820698 RepID=A0A8T4HED8_9SPHI|nr:hypothetical protein [Sphingobacteriaceae bacterium WQ 2009]